MPRTENKSTPIVVGDTLYHTDSGLTVGSAEWFAWLNQEDHNRFYYESPIGTFTASKESRNRQMYWYAYRRALRKRHGTSETKLHKAYLGKSEDLTADRLLEIARWLAEQVQL
jgi:LuxR family maltose regulon positive regulatory protein